MALRTSDRAVRAVIPIASTTNTSQFMEAANALTDYVSSQDANSVLTTALLIKIETYLAAHFAALYDQQYTSKQTLSARAEFQVGKPGEGLRTTEWGRAAIVLDRTGTLAKSGRRAQVAWLGLPPSSQTDYVDRD